ncbi:hypothetical protein Thimo_0152 [Thioflavicoccus mobilis 8321]|uniref:Uncharacterized protein n=1 Tax=Thioflavicoccus mobilis 8321 TaxID=765912 RepID=L0GT90_9GAMM|nr:hypothetical protein [Thioflavicoccus mobilis]AGA89027.1 hypothetical protein Thimo_0152 [Thioflavicoccus mobilis 8321]
MALAAVRGRLVVVGLVWVLWALAAPALGKNYVVPDSEAAQLEHCVEPTEVMRRNHMQLIRHQRDATVHGGIRSTKYSLARCVACHASYEDGKPIPVAAKGQFCQTCHAFAAVTLDCFQCHKTVPDGAGHSPGFGAGRQGGGSQQ